MAISDKVSPNSVEDRLWDELLIPKIDVEYGQIFLKFLMVNFFANFDINEMIFNY